MMALALELGQSVATLKSTMTEREFRAWEIYASRKMLPTRRIELYLAQIARAMAGGKITDYLFDQQAEQDLDFKPINKRK
jgi:hypothetical protein